MVIKSIQLENFRQYKGKQDKLVFPIENDKNVIVILGINTSGKTTLIQAFQWCLYGNEGVSFRNKDLLNVEVERELKINESCEVNVDITLVHEQREYVVIRSQTFTKIDNEKIKKSVPTVSMSYRDSDGSQKSIADVGDAIKRILPKDLASYFFFDGERISDLNSRKDVKESVEGLLGLDVIGATKKRLEKIISSYSKDIVTSDENSGLAEKLEKAEAALELLEIDIETYTSDKAALTKAKECLDESAIINYTIKKRKVV